MFKMTSKELRVVLLIAIVVFAFAAIIFWYDSSSLNYNEYLRICRANYADELTFNRCLEPFYTFSKNGKIGFIASLVLVVSSAVAFIVNLANRKL